MAAKQEPIRPARGVRRKSPTASLKSVSPPLKEGSKSPPRPRRKKPASLPRSKKAPWMAPSEDQKIKWGIRLLAALVLIVAVCSGEITWTGDGVRIGLRHAPPPIKSLRGDGKF